MAASQSKDYWDATIASGTRLLKDHSNSAMHGFVPESLSAFLLSELSAFLIVGRMLLVRWLETLVVLSVSASAPIFFHLYRLPDGSKLNYNQSWSMISFLLVFPLTQSMTGAFQRRERGIAMLQTFKSNCISLILAHKDWDWLTVNAKDSKEPPSGGRAPRLSPDHAHQVLLTFKKLIAQIEILLLAPTTSIMMFFLASSDVNLVREASRKLRKGISHIFRDLSHQAEELKAAGMPANEATRIRQYFSAIIDSYNQLISIKQYHTPLGLRAFTRIFILLLPWLFGPYLGNLAASTGLAFAVTFSVVQSSALQALFVIRFSLEDPFIALNLPKGGRDAIDVNGELGELMEDLEMFVGEGLQKSPDDSQEAMINVTVSLEEGGVR